MTPVPIEVGLYGKLPSHGDFLRRRVSDRFVGVWDSWLQECFAASRDVLGERWLDVYLTSPAWRFACSRGVFGDSPMLGLMVPSVDRVGRYFHLAVVAALPAGVNVVAAASAAEPFFAYAERLLIDTLASAHVDFNAFDRDVLSLVGYLEPVTTLPDCWLDAAASDVLSDHAGGVHWQVPMRDVAQMRPMFDQLMERRLLQLYDPLVMWWTAGSPDVEPSCLIGRGLPSPGAFAALLDGSWVGWQSVPEMSPSLEAPAEDELDEPVPPRYRSAAATDVGHVRSINQDSFLERPEVGLWCVADGMGGHQDGEVASRMVCDALADFVPDASFEHMVEAASERIRQVNDHLVRAANREYNAVRSGSTVVALLTRGTRCAIVWAGDSRVYRLRHGRIEQLTRDHSLAELTDGEAQGSTAITRAVGGEEVLALDVYRDRVAVGDRFLLCSDGLTRTLPADQIRTWMSAPDVGTAVNALIQGTLDAGAPDNVTVVLVDAYEPA